MRNFLLALLLLAIFFSACNSEKNTTSSTDVKDSLKVQLDSTRISEADPSEKKPDTTELEFDLLDQGLVNIHSLDTGIRLDIKYSTEDNFLEEDVYGDFNACYLQAPAARRLVKADSFLQALHPDLRLLVHDCVRPRSVQFKMWEIVKGTDQQMYVAPPGGAGSMHNYGAAVDLSLVHVDSGLVDMGTDYDYFGELAQPRYEERFVKEGKLTQAQVANRRVLRYAMLQAGFHGILSEWWHFNAFPREEVKARFQIVELE